MIKNLIYQILLFWFFFFNQCTVNTEGKYHGDVESTEKNDEGDLSYEAEADSEFDIPAPEIDLIDTIHEETADANEGELETPPACIDNDKDGYGEGCTLGPDCDDADPNNWSSCDECVDNDGDGFFFNCDAFITISQDCNDANFHCNNDDNDCTTDENNNTIPDCEETVWIETIYTSDKVSEELYHATATGDDSIVIAGTTWGDYLFFKINLEGNIINQTTLRAHTNAAKHILHHPTVPEYFISTGVTDSFGAGGDEIWVVKFQGDGSINWQKVYGGSDDDIGKCAILFNENIYILADTRSFGAGDTDWLIVKIDPSGNVSDSMTIGGNQDDTINYGVVSSTGTGFYLAGFTRSFNAQSRDGLIVKFSSGDTVEWAKLLGASGNERISSIAPTPDGGIIAVGRTTSSGEGGIDGWIVKLDEDGNITWQKSIGGEEDDWLESVVWLNEGGFAVAGRTKSENFGDWDIFLAGFNDTGGILWQKVIGSDVEDIAYSITQASDTDLIVVGATRDFIDDTRNGLVIKIYSNGQFPISCPYISDATLVPGDTSVTATDVSSQISVESLSISANDPVPHSTDTDAITNHFECPQSL